MKIFIIFYHFDNMHSIITYYDNTHVLEYNFVYISTKLDSWGSSNSVQSLGPPLIGWDLESINHWCSRAKLWDFLRCLHSPYQIWGTFCFFVFLISTKIIDYRNYLFFFLFTELHKYVIISHSLVNMIVTFNFSRVYARYNILRTFHSWFYIKVWITVYNRER